MDYETFIDELRAPTFGLIASISDWKDLDVASGEAIRTACEREVVDVQALQDVRASLAAEQAFFRSLQSGVEDYRTQLAGLKQFYAATVIAQPQAEAVYEEQSKAGLFGLLKRPVAAQPAAIARQEVVEPPSNTDQRAFIALKQRLSQLDDILAGVREDIAAMSESAEDDAFGLKSEVVRINAQLRSAIAEQAAKKLETRRFYLEEAIGMLSERVVFLGLQHRVVGKMFSNEVVENPFEDEAFAAAPARRGRL